MLCFQTTCRASELGVVPRAQIFYGASHIKFRGVRGTGDLPEVVLRTASRRDGNPLLRSERVFRLCVELSIRLDLERFTV